MNNTNIMKKGDSCSVELLQDRKGIYGLGSDQGACPWGMGQKILLRPDWLDDQPWGRWIYSGQPIYQGITGGFRHGMFSHTPEECLRQLIHHDLLRQAGLPWPPNSNDPRVRYWSTDKKVQDRNRGIYHGLRRRSLVIINRMIWEALGAAAVPDAVRQARRFRFRYRRTIYEAGARSRRALQLSETFPVLALAVYSPKNSTNSDGSDQRAAEAAELVERGATLKTVASCMNVPMAMRKVKPGAADTALTLLQHHEVDELLFHAYLPATLNEMRSWLTACLFTERVDPGFLNWTAKNALQLGRKADDIVPILNDIADWVRACNQAKRPGLSDSSRPDALPWDEPVPMGGEFVTRPFSPDMSLKTVLRLSGQWHEDVAANMRGPSFRFPDPWYDGATIGDYEIRPIANSAELYLEGRLMHHCVGTYANRVQAGEIFVYSVLSHGKRVATVELIWPGEHPVLGQVRGPCNSQVDSVIIKALRKWMRDQPGPRLRARSAVVGQRDGSIFTKALDAADADTNAVPGIWRGQV